MDHKLFIAIQFFICIINHSFCSDPVKYDNHTLYQAVPANQKQLDFLNTLLETYDVKYWRYPSRADLPVDFLVPPTYKYSFLRSAEQHNLQLKTLLQDVQTEFDKQTVTQYVSRRTDSFHWHSYFRLDDIYSWMTDLSKANPDLMKVFRIGKSYENRDILAACISLGSLQKKSMVIIEGGIHAREWISPAFVTYAMHQVLNSQSSKDNDLKHVGLKYEWCFVPIMNPDGYEYTHTHDRLWRKNRRGPGVDLNRNFDIAFGKIGVSSDKGYDTYCGTHAFSEPETKAMADFVKSKSTRLKFYLAFHSYGQLLIFPYAHSEEHLENFDEMKLIGNAASRKINERYGTVYRSGTAYDTVGYKSSGVSGCWVKKTFKVPYVATFELRDEGQYGFSLPPKYILPTCQETMDGIVSILTLQKQVSGIENTQECASSNFFFVISIIFLKFIL